MKKFIFRLSNAYRRHGIMEFIRLSGFNIRHFAMTLFCNPHSGAAEDGFDRIYGTETSAFREIGSLDIQSENSRVAVRYEPSSERSIRGLIERAEAQFDLSDFAFIDFGSGKGRVLIVAGQYPFAELIGIEFSPELNEIAARNIARLPREITRHNRVSLVCSDVVMFEPPRRNLVCYFYNPFGESVMSQVAKRLAAHNKDFGCRVIIIYVNPQHLETFQLTGAFTTLGETEHGTILTTNNACTEAQSL